MRQVSPSRAFVGFLGLLFAASQLVTPATFAQNRIRTNITNGTRAAITNSIHPRVRTSTDQGPMAGDTKLSMSLRFSMTDAQSAALNQLLADQQNPASPRYHQWLTPAQFGAQFGLSQADLAKVTAWLTAQGFTVTGVANGGTYVSFDGTVAQAEAAFGTSIHNLKSSNGEQHFANITNITVPAALNGVVGDITGLHDFHPHAHLGNVAHPLYTSSVSGNHYVVPGDFYAIYDMEPLLTAGFNGSGVTIAVTGQVDLYNNSTSDVSAFRSAAGLNATILPTTVHPVLNTVTEDPGQARGCSGCSPNAGDLDESSIDVEWSGAMAPGANVLFVSSACGVLPGGSCAADSMTWAIDNNLAPIVTTSYGDCETGWGSTDLNAANTLFMQAASQGQTIVASAGDSGATDCDSGVTPSGTSFSPAIEGLNVDFPASSPFVVAMGGSMFNEGTATGATPYWLGTDTIFTAGSAVPNADVSAKGYIPEAVWNEDSSSSPGFADGGGGVSAFFSKPAWQVETGAVGMTTSVPADASRDVPDLALDAASEHDGLLLCAQGSCVSGFRQSAGGILTEAGGTSFDSQAFGGMLADIEQKVGSRLGLINPTIYALGNQVAYYNSTGTSVYHDISSGNNSNACSQGTTNCPNGGSIGYNATSGYDLATGWGSVDLNNLASAWTQVTPIALGPTGSCAAQLTCAISSTSLVASTTSVASGSSVTLTATVTGSAGIPTGTVQFLDNSVALGSPVTLNSSGVATYTYTAACSSLGQQQMNAVYSGSTTYAGSKGPALPTGEYDTTGGATLSSNGSINTTPLIVTVTTGVCSDFSLTPSGTSSNSATISVSGSNATVSVSSGGTIPPVTLTVAPLNGFTGTVSFTSTTTSTTTYTPTVTFSSSSLTFTGSSSASQTTTVNFSGITADLHLPAMPKAARRPWYSAGSGIAIASLFLVFFPRRRRLGGLFAVLIAVALVFGTSGCGSSSSTTGGSTTGGGTTGGGTTTTTNPEAGTYTVTVTATYSNNGQNTVHASTITYLIN